MSCAPLGQRTGDGDSMRRRSRVGCGCFFWGGGGRGRGVPGRVFAEKFSQNGGFQTVPCVLYIIYCAVVVFAAVFRAIAKGGSSIHGRPGQTRAMFQTSTARRPVHALTTVEGLLP